MSEFRPQDSQSEILIDKLTDAEPGVNAYRNYLLYRASDKQGTLLVDDFVNTERFPERTVATLALISLVQQGLLELNSDNPLKLTLTNAGNETLSEIMPPRPKT